MKKCKNIICPVCGAGFEVCFIDQEEPLPYGAICPVCDHHFPVTV